MKVRCIVSYERAKVCLESKESDFHELTNQSGIDQAQGCPTFADACLICVASRVINMLVNIRLPRYERLRLQRYFQTGMQFHRTLCTPDV